MRDLEVRVKSARGSFPVVGVGPFDGLQTSRARTLAGTKSSGKGTGNHSSTSRGRGIGDGAQDAKRPSSSKTRHSDGGAERGGLSHGTTYDIETWTVFALSTDGPHGSSLSESWTARRESRELCETLWQCCEDSARSVNCSAQDGMDRCCCLVCQRMDHAICCSEVWSHLA